MVVLKDKSIKYGSAGVVYLYASLNKNVKQYGIKISNSLDTGVPL